MNASFLQTCKAVAWSFFGVRKGVDLEKDARLNPVHVVIGGVLGALLLVAVLLLLVNWALSAAT